MPKKAFFEKSLTDNSTNDETEWVVFQLPP